MFSSDEKRGFDPASFHDALEIAADAGAPPPVPSAFRQRERAATADRYVQIYRRALERHDGTTFSDDLIAPSA